MASYCAKCQCVLPFDRDTCPNCGCISCTPFKMNTSQLADLILLLCAYLTGLGLLATTFAFVVVSYFLLFSRYPGERLGGSIFDLQWLMIAFILQLGLLIVFLRVRELHLVPREKGSDSPSSSASVADDKE